MREGQEKKFQKVYFGEIKVSAVCHDFVQWELILDILE